MAANASLVLNDGTPLTLAAQIGNAGGEGTTYRITGAPNLVVKIYHTPASTPAVEKLSWMIAHPPVGASAGQGNVVLAWPQSLVKDRSSGQVVGFTMPLIDQSWEVSRVFDPALRRHLKTTHGEQIGWHHLHEIAINLARVVESCHAAGYVVGDLNNNNTRVSNTGQISLIDTDSFQVTVNTKSTKHIHYCTVVYPEYTPPELLGKDYSKTERYPETDCFILALLIFKLLQDQTHAFQGASSDQSLNDPMVLVSKGWFPYSTKSFNQRVQPHPLAPPFARLHSELRDLFQRAFVDGHGKPQLRPSASEWAAALMTARQSLQRCTRQHYYAEEGAASFCMQRVQAQGGGYCGSTAKSQRSTPIPYTEINSLTGERIKPWSKKSAPVSSPSVAPVQTSFTPPTPKTAPPAPASPPPITPTAPSSPPPVTTNPSPRVQVPPPSPAAIRKSSFDPIGVLFRRGLAIVVIAALFALALVPTGIGSRLVESARQFQGGSNPIPPSVARSSGQAAAGASAAALLASQPTDGLMLFSAHQTDGWSLVAFDPASGKEEEVFGKLAIAPVPAWSHDGGRFAYAVKTESGMEVRFLRRLTGKTARIGSLSSSMRVTRIAWNADDTALLLSVSDANGPRVVKMDTSTGGTSVFLPVSSINLATSSHGDTAYSVEQQGDLDLVVGDKDGKACCYVAESGSDEGDPSFSPDGALIAFDVSSGARHRVAIDNRDGSSRVTIPDPSQGVSSLSTMPAWSPGGDRIAFISCVSDRCRIFSTSLTGTAQTSSPKILLSTSRYDRITSLSWYGAVATIEPK